MCPERVRIPGKWFCQRSNPADRIRLERSIGIDFANAVGSLIDHFALLHDKQGRSRNAAIRDRLLHNLKPFLQRLRHRGQCYDEN